MSARNPFTLLAHVGEDCAGAVQFCRPDRVAELRNEVHPQIMRVHQEDFCQALSIPPRIEYEAEGGPGAGAMAAVLREFSSAPAQDQDTLLRALALNWVIGGTDAHAKNFSLLIAARQVRLAPLYDAASIFPYLRRIPLQKANLALRVGGEYRIAKIGRRHWERLVTEMGLGSDAVGRVREVVREAPGRMEEVCAGARGEGINHPVVDTLEEAVRRHAAACMRALDQPLRH